MVLYRKCGLTLLTAEGNNTAINLFHRTDHESVAEQLRCFHLQNRVALAGRYALPPSVIAQCGSVVIAKN